MNIANAVLTRCGDILQAPFDSWPLCALILWSAVAGVAMTYVFGKTSNQTALRRAADRTRAQLLAIKLFKDDLGVTFGCQVQLMKATGQRLLHSLPPMLVMIVPFVLILSQLALRYEFAPLEVGDTAIVELQISPDAWDKYQNVSMEVPTGITVETGSLRDVSQQTVSWRIRPEKAEPAVLRWKIGERTVTKKLTAAEDPQQLVCVSPRRPGDGLWDRLLHPAEPGFAEDGPVRGIDVEYPPRQTPVLGVAVPWWGTFLIVSMLVAVIVRRFLGVQF